MGRRGGGWVAVQALLIAAIALSALAGSGWSGPLAPLAYALAGVLFALGAVLLLAGGSALGRALTPFPAPRAGGELRSDGVYGLVRHPMYGGGVLASLGWTVLFATLPGLVLTVWLAVFADLKSRREERWLEERYPGYPAYRARVRRRLLPFVW